jgi:hypothetical protein
MSALRRQVSEQSGNVLLGDQRLHGVIAHHSGGYKGKTFDRVFEPFKVSVRVFAMPSGGQLDGRQLKGRHMLLQICNG